MTRIRIATARVIWLALRPFVGTRHRRITRKGVTYEVDLSEGIDLSLFLFGEFQSHVSRAALAVIRPDAVVLDIGANIGSMSLAFCRLIPNGTVFSFEPTDYAFKKLVRNLELNPKLAPRIHPVKAFLARDDCRRAPSSIYSSWSLQSGREGTHSLHGGTKRSAAAASVLTVDGFCEKTALERVDLMKIDTDGYEFEVLLGAQRTLKEQRPVLIFEAGLYGMKEMGFSFQDLLELLRPSGYRLVNLKNGHPLTLETYRQEIPQNFTTDVLAVADL